jgi:sugar/nucleoside kinase (ribokinase family)
MDVIARVDYAFLERFGKQAGTMHLVEYDEIVRLLREIGPCRTMAGGSAANTARGFAWLASEAGKDLRESILGSRASTEPPSLPVFNGAIGADQRGDEFFAHLSGAGVHASLVRKATPTGTSIILVTPDSERTMNTFLGACRDFQAADLDLDRLAVSRMLYLTAYLWDTDNQCAAAEKAAAFAKEHGIAIAFDLADPFAVRRYGDQLRSWIPGRVDILFGNRDELALLTQGACDEDCVTDAASLAPLVVRTGGARGCLVGGAGGSFAVAGVPVTLVDTTGAGDAFAAGFLFAWLAGAEPVTCARLANALAARIVSAEGCNYSG